MSDMNYKTPLECNVLNAKQVSHYIRTASTPAEKRVWRNLLNSEAFHKVKDGKLLRTHTRLSKKVVEEASPKGKKKK